MIALTQAEFDIIQCADEAAWLKERDNGIGASEVAVLLGLSDWSSPYHLWAQKTGKIAKPESDAEFLEWGRFAEDGIARRYAYRTGRTLRDPGRFTIMRSKAHPFLFATLDRIIESVPASTEGLYPWQSFMVGEGPCEIKQATLFGFHAWDEGPPLKVEAQLQTQIAVGGYRWGSIAATMPDGKFDAVDRPRNQAFIDLVIETCSTFWDCVKGDKWPPVDGSDWTRKALKAMFPMDTGAVVQLPPESVEWANELEQSKEQIKLGTAHKDEMTNRFAAALGSASEGQLPDGRVYTYCAQSREGYTVAPTTFRVLRKAAAPKKKSRAL